MDLLHGLPVMRGKTQPNSGCCQRYKVENVKWRGHLKTLTIKQDSAFTSELDVKNNLVVPLSACVSNNDTLLISGPRVYVQCQNGIAQITPPYVSKCRLTVGGIEIDTLFKEVTQADEHHSCMSLAKFHYRDRTLFGRTSRLIARTFNPSYPSVLGYIELATPFYVNKARAKLLNAPFSASSISWTGWNKNTTRRYIHLIVRIARFVVHPEFRGLGLGSMLIDHAEKFARSRWQVSRLMPCFLEISADMLKYVHFAERAGLSFIGETEGNVDRVAKDMRYLTKNADRVRNKNITLKDAFGIADQQAANMERTLKLQEEQGWSREQLIRRLKRLSVREVLHDYELFWDIVRLPKPTYMKGLTKTADRFIQRRTKELSLVNGWTVSSTKTEPLAGPLVARDLTLTYVTKVRRTQQSHAIQQAFGISPIDIRNVVVKGFSINIQPGEVVLVIGPSGSGKTTFMNALSKCSYMGSLKQEGKILYPKNTKIGFFEPIRSRKALIEIFSDNGTTDSIRQALNLLGCVGLSDAFVFIKRFCELSTGQQYRAMLAKLIVSRANIWFVDEFCANLDSVTANIVADRLQKTARKFGATIIAAAPNCETFLHAFKPDRVILLTNSWEHRVESGPNYISKLLTPVHWRTNLRRIRVKPELFSSICQGDQNKMVLKNRQSIEKGPLLLRCGKDQLLVQVLDVRHVKSSELTSECAPQDKGRIIESVITNFNCEGLTWSESVSLTLIEFQRI